MANQVKKKELEKIVLVRYKFRKYVLKCIWIVREMNLNTELLSENSFPTEPYWRGNKAENFFWLVKSNEIRKVDRMIDDDPFIIYEFDHVGQTVLHHAAKRDFWKLVKLLVKSGAQIDK